MSDEKVIIAMSGGVDSSVTGKLLLDQGYECMGITMELKDLSAQNPDSTCGTSKDIEDARSVAAKLGMSFEVYDCRGKFKECVVDPFCETYLNGETPNPCVECNRYLKFGALQERRQELGFDYVATGHYAQRCYDPDSGRYLLKKGLDPKKDQSYFLYHMTQDQLAHMLLPLGGLSKEQVRAEADAAGFITADKAESQDVCFIPDGDYVTFIKSTRGIEFEPGPIINHEGKIVGTHTGLPCYTMGQRKGLGVAYSEPLYVLEKDLENNALLVGPKSMLGVSKIFATDVNLISVVEINEPIEVEIKANYRQIPKRARVYVNEQGLLVAEMLEPVQSCSPGQALVMYDGDTVVGGGTICGYERIDV